MLDLLGDVSGRTVLEPAAGRGAFIEGLQGRPRLVHCVDVNKSSLDHIDRKFSSVATTIHADFIDLFVSQALRRQELLLPEYDTAIANPPYGLKFSEEYRRLIRFHHPNVYARESYGLFFQFTLDLLRHDGRYVFIVPDTFLHSLYHRSLRRALVKRGAPSHIIQFRSARFRTVNFGYGNLCIVAGNARALQDADIVHWVDLTRSKRPLGIDAFDRGSQVPARHLVRSCDEGWIHPTAKAALDLQCPHSALGEIAECRTGIYTGNNSKFVGYDRNLSLVRGNGHPIDWAESVHESSLSLQERRDGIHESPHYVPLIRGGHRLPFARTRWAIDWSHQSVHFYATNQKARLQNSAFYFRRGLAVPMVTAGRISASLMEGAVFDQGVVGVFPNDDRLIDFLLIYLNSEFVSTRLKLAINGSANNSANYIKKLPVPTPSETQITYSQSVIADAKRFGWETTASQRDHLLKTLIGNQTATI